MLSHKIFKKPSIILKITISADLNRKLIEANFFIFPFRKSHVNGETFNNKSMNHLRRCKSFAVVKCRKFVAFRFITHIRTFFFFYLFTLFRMHKNFANLFKLQLRFNRALNEQWDAKQAHTAGELLDFTRENLSHDISVLCYHSAWRHRRLFNLFSQVAGSRRQWQLLISLSSFSRQFCSLHNSYFFSLCVEPCDNSQKKDIIR